ncbi:hypothetical protein IEO21_10341 [Rhodonia placenta]|uniref:Uncharacterized protein n=1 Tax=Rhodonia placenta TaxID=104341 RepID=A0A8H7TXM6_9APHY|nr:hypothetical protein IEO21_10341 [Postia placenta]
MRGCKLIPPSVCFGGVSFTRIVVRSRSSPALAVTTSTLSPRGVLWKHVLITSSFSGRSGMLVTCHAPPSHLAPPPARRLPRSWQAGGRCPPAASASSRSQDPCTARRLRISRIARAPCYRWRAPCPPENRRALTSCVTLMFVCSCPRAQSPLLRATGGSFTLYMYLRCMEYKPVELLKKTLRHINVTMPVQRSARLTGPGPELLLSGVWLLSDRQVHFIIPLAYVVAIVLSGVTLPSNPSKKGLLNDSSVRSNSTWRWKQAYENIGVHITSRAGGCPIAAHHKPGHREGEAIHW